MERRVVLQALDRPTVSLFASSHGLSLTLPGLRHVVAEPAQHVRVCVAHEGDVPEGLRQGQLLEGEVRIVLLLALGQAGQQLAQVLSGHAVRVDEGGGGGHEGQDVGRPPVHRYTAGEQGLEHLP